MLQARRLQPKAAVRRCSSKDLSLRFCRFHGNFIWFSARGYGKPPFVDSVQPYQKEATGQVFSRECFEISKNTYFVEHLRTAALALIAHDHATLSWSKKVWKQPL